MTENVTFRIITPQSLEYAAFVSVRQAELRTPLGRIYTPEELSIDAEHILIVGFKGNELVATAILVPKGDSCKIRQVAVLSSVQRLGIGSRLMAFCETHARDLTFQYIFCHARKHAVPFYEHNGYVSEGEYFLELEMPHLYLKKIL